MLGVLVNAVTVVAGSLSGLFFQKGIPESASNGTMTRAGSLLFVVIGTSFMRVAKIKVADYLYTIVFAPMIHNIAALF